MSLTASPFIGLGLYYLLVRPWLIPNQQVAEYQPDAAAAVLFDRIDLDDRPDLAMYDLGAYLDTDDDRGWPAVKAFVADLYLHHDEDVRADAVRLLAIHGESYDAFRDDQSKRVQDTIIRWDTGELPPEYDSLGG